MIAARLVSLRSELKAAVVMFLLIPLVMVYRCLRRILKFLFKRGKK